MKSLTFKYTEISLEAHNMVYICLMLVIAYELQQTYYNKAQSIFQNNFHQLFKHFAKISVRSVESSGLLPRMQKVSFYEMQTSILATDILHARAHKLFHLNPNESLLVHQIVEIRLWNECLCNQSSLFVWFGFFGIKSRN